jgi:hypothetical protein
MIPLTSARPPKATPIITQKRLAMSAAGWLCGLRAFCLPPQLASASTGSMQRSGLSRFVSFVPRHVVNADSTFPGFFRRNA